VIWKKEVRQGPAAGVIPVFTPKNPSIANNLLVLYQEVYLEWEKVLLKSLHLYIFFLTIYLKMGFFMA
jgi:hypothetical protein